MLLIDNPSFPGSPKAPRGTGACVLYLDFDGVLHHENCWWDAQRGPHLQAPERYTLFQHTDLLSDVLNGYPQWKIVLSTSWVMSLGCDKAAKRLPEALRKRVIGATFHSGRNKSEFQSMDRGQQVLSDVRRRLPGQWIALDDDDNGWPSWCHDRFLKTHQYEGISDPPVLDRIKKALEKYSC